MKREQVYKVIDTEREYQEKATLDLTRPDMIEDFNMGTALQALNVLLRQTGDKWYKDCPEKNYRSTMDMLRKIAGVCVQMGEKYDMPIRYDNPLAIGNDEFIELVDPNNMCLECHGTGSFSGDIMHTEKCGFCNGTGQVEK